MSQKVFEIVTERITKLMEQGTVPWRKPWDASASAPQNIGGWNYNGINYFMLGMMGYEVPVFLTLKQINDAGGRLKVDAEGKKESGLPVFFFKRLTFTKDKATGLDLENPRTIPLLRYTLVWNIAQVDGVKLPKRFEKKGREFTTIEAAEQVVKGYANGPQVAHGGNRACYSPNLDKVQMPTKESFHKEESYYSTLFHEFSHSTGHKSRLDRKKGMENISFGSHDYSEEELVAEMGAAFLCAHCGIDNTLENSAAYLQGWMKSFKDEPKMLMFAAAKAQKAFNLITKAPEAETPEE